MNRLRNNQRVFVLCAQAGQGKSVAAAQFLQGCGSAWLWYRLDEDDSSAVVFLRSFYQLLRERLPHFRLPFAEDVLEQENCDFRILLGALTQLLTALQAHLDSARLHVVFDDVHRLQSDCESMGLLCRLLANAPPQLRFIMLGRRLCEPLLRELTASEPLWLDNELLAFTEAEIDELYRRHWGVELDAHCIRRLHQQTGGWCAGIVTYAEALKKTPALIDPASGAIDTSATATAARGAIYRLFRYQIFKPLTASTQHLLAAAAWLEDVDPFLLNHVLGVTRPERILRELVEDQLFIEPPRPGTAAYRFNPVFRDFLRSESAVVLSESERGQLLRRAAEWQQKCGRYTSALGYALAAREYAHAESLLIDHSELLLQQNQPNPLIALLRDIPPDRLHEHPWLSLLLGTLLLQTDPPAALEHTEGARSSFSVRGDNHGELAATASRLILHNIADGVFEHAPPLQSRLQSLLSDCGSNLAPALALLANTALAASHSFIHGRVDRADAHIDQGLQTAQNLGASNHETIIRLIRAYSDILQGRLERAEIETEHLHDALRKPSTSPLNRVLIRGIICDILICLGDLQGFERHTAKLERLSDSTLIRKSLAGPMLSRWRCERALQEDDFDAVLVHAEAGLAIGFAAFNPHMRSQLLQYRALAHAVRGEEKAAREDAEEAGRLRAESGGLHFYIRCEILLGATYTILGDHGLAAEHLNTAIGQAVAIDALYALVGAYAYRVRLHLARNEPEAAREDTATFLALMKRNNYRCCFGWNPSLMREILQFAVKAGVEAEYARQLAEQRLGIYFDREAQPRPLLQIQTLGGFEMRLGGARMINTRDITPRPQQYLATLVAAPGQELARDHLQELMWPDGGQSTSKLYALRNRIKKVFTQQHLEIDIDTYLVLRGSLARLEHVEADAHRFQALVAAGMRHYRSRRYWHADSAFYKAGLLWHGSFFPTAPDTDLSRDYRAELERLNSQRVTLWADILTELGDTAEAIELLNGHFDSDPANTELAARLHQLQLITGNTNAATRTLRRCQRALAEEGYPADELEPDLKLATRASSNPR